MFKAVIDLGHAGGPARILFGTLAVLLSTASAGFSQQYSISTVAGGAAPATPATATAASIGQPARVAVDGAGNFYFSSQNSVFRVNSAGILTLVAGNSRAGFSGDGGPAVNAQLNNPQGIAVDSAGNVYIADSGNNRVRLVSPAGIISTFAGNGLTGTYGSVGDYQAVDANLSLPSDVAVDASGNVYIADTGHHSIRKVDTTGGISLFAGDTYPGYSGNDAAASSAELRSPKGVAVDSSGNVYVADTGNAVIRKIDTDGKITAFAGSGSQGFSGDGGAALKATMTEPFSVAVDASGNVYIAEVSGGRIRKVDTSAKINTLAGKGTAGFTGDGSQATAAQFSLPTGVAVDSAGNVYVADSMNLRIRKIAGGSISTVAGNGVYSYSGNGGPAAKAQMDNPAGVAVDPAGNIYVSDTGNNVVRKIDASGTIAAVAAQLSAPAGLALDQAGNLYIAESQNNRIRKLAADGTLSTIAGSGSPGFSGDGGAATSAQLNAPSGVAVDGGNNVYIADFGNSRVRKVGADGVISTLAGTGVWAYAGDGGQAASAQLNGPQGVAVDASGNVYIADTNNHRVRMVTPGGAISTIAGNGAATFSGDFGPAVSAGVGSPNAVAADSAGNVFVTSGGSRVRQIYPGGIIATVAGNGAIGYSGDGGAATSAQLNTPSGLAVDASGNVFVADTGNKAIRALQPLNSSDIAIAAVTNAASNLTGPVAPGEILTLYGSGMGPAALVPMELDFSGKVSRSLAGVTVYVNGAAAPLVYVSANQVAAIIPYAVDGSSIAQVFVKYQGRTSAPFTVSVQDAAPALFTLDSSGKGQAAAVNNVDNVFSINTPNNPAKIGKYISLYVSGSGQTNPMGTDGLLAAVPLPIPLLPVTVTIGGKQATVTYAGAAPGSVAGLMQVDAQVPDGTAGSAVPVVVKVGDRTTPAGVTIAISN